MSFIQDALEAEYHSARGYSLYVVNRRPQTPYLVAMASVYGVPRFADLDFVRSRLNAIRELLLDRTFDMARFEKRFPVRGIIAEEHYCDQDRLLRAFRLCCWCRPPGVIYPPKTQKKKIQACGHYNFCAACWARVVVRQYEQYEQLIAAFNTANPRQHLYVTTHISEAFIPFDGVLPDKHVDDETYAKAVTLMSKTLTRYKARISRHRKQVNRKTAASIWRIVPIATDGGWRVQFRQMFITLPGTKPPIKVYRDERVVLHQTNLLAGKITDDATVSFIAFAAYPEEHLKDDLDLTSASLNAMARQHMLGGTGKFRAAGKALIDRARKIAACKKKTTQKNGTQKTA